MSEQEQDARPQEYVPPPAVEEVRKAGASQLPGFESVPERPAEQRKAWTA